MKALRRLAAFASLAIPGVAGWKLARLRGRNPHQAPAFTRLGQYTGRAAWIGALVSALLTFIFWLTLASLPVATGYMNMATAFATAILMAALSLPFGAIVGLAYGLVWYSTDSVRRANMASAAESGAGIEPGTEGAPSKTGLKQAFARGDYSGLTLPPTLGATNRAASTGDPLWDNFHNTAPRMS